MVKCSPGSSDSIGMGSIRFVERRDEVATAMNDVPQWIGADCIHA